MQGRIKTYNQERAFGFIIGDDGNDYFFHISNWKCVSPVIRGATVTFTPDETNRGKIAKQIILDEAARNRPTFISFGNETIRLGNIKTYGISAGNALFVKVYEYKKAPVVRKGLFTSKTEEIEGYHWCGDKEQFKVDDVYRCKNDITFNDGGRASYQVRIYIPDRNDFRWSSLALERASDGKIIPVSQQERLKGLLGTYLSWKRLGVGDIFTETQNYLYITTYQQDNYQFYEGLADFDIYEKKKELDRHLACGK